jgi:hypothetical protein
MFQTDILFGIPIYKVRVDPNLYDKKNIISTIEKNYSIGPRDNFDKNTKMHMLLFDEKNSLYEKINYEKLQNVYNNIFKNFVNNLKLNHKGNLKCDYQIVNYTASNKEGNMQSHHHLPDDNFASVHYLQLDKKQNTTSFDNTHVYGNYLKYIFKDIYNVVDNKDSINSYLFENFKIDAQEDDMIIFPSVAKHYVEKQNFVSNKLRITIASNIKLSL